MDKIPKIIHYCWFRGNSLSKLAEKCIESWMQYCPGYVFQRWDESNFDINCNQYVKEAYESKKWALVSDYVRLHALYEYGGIYMDTDVELLKKIDNLLGHEVFSGYEIDNKLPTAIMGSIKNHRWIKYLLSYYNNKHFINNDGSFDLTTNVTIITNMTKKRYKINLNNTYQVLEHGIAIYPKDYFCPKNYLDGKIKITDNTYCIHHFNASWHTEEERKKHRKKIFYKNFFGKTNGEFIFLLNSHANKYGWISMIKLLIKLSIRKFKPDFRS
ncbi:glycosyltransferase [Neobacillus terrae]|uniref:glycosyltransferase n=1 Tax=Neobacillus terrae TaxID=3034837 RepID=UPI0014085EBB|nr:glycosyltransferase [Neobacillus terrae]NHM29283.1 glycosyl transferase [Neobacillus terrae]